VVDVYNDNVGAFFSSWEHHIKLLNTIFHHLNEMIHSKVNGLSKKLTGLVIGSVYVVLNHGGKKSM
jgi:Mg2+ and Co2+ transporter CorA